MSPGDIVHTHQPRFLTAPRAINLRLLWWLYLVILHRLLVLMNLSLSLSGCISTSLFGSLSACLFLPSSLFCLPPFFFSFPLFLDTPLLFFLFSLLFIHLSLRLAVYDNSLL